MRVLKPLLIAGCLLPLTAMAADLVVSPFIPKGVDGLIELNITSLVASELDFHVPAIPVASNLTGKLEREALCDPVYWRRHVRHTVLFADGITSMVEAGTNTFIEMGPHPILLGMGQRTAPDLDGTWLPSMHRDEDAHMLALNDIGRIRLRTTQPLFADEYARNRATGSFILIDESTNNTVAAGMIVGTS